MGTKKLATEFVAADNALFVASVVASPSSPSSSDEAVGRGRPPENNAADEPVVSVDASSPSSSGDDVGKDISDENTAVAEIVAFKSGVVEARVVNETEPEESVDDVRETAPASETEAGPGRAELTIAVPSEVADATEDSDIRLSASCTLMVVIVPLRLPGSVEFPGSALQNV